MRRSGKHDVQLSIFKATGLLFALFFGVSLLGGQAPSALVRAAAARSCASVARFIVYPANDELAPRNARVVVVAKPSRGTPGWRGHDPPEIVLLADDADGRSVVPTSAEKTAAGDLTTIVVAPAALLAPNRTYSVTAGPNPIGRFRTSAEIDREPPRWEGVNEIETSLRAPEPSYSCFGFGGVSLRIEPAVDPEHGASQLSYAFFVGQAKTPFLYQRPFAGQLYLDADDAVWRDLNAERFDLTIRAADMAGNFSAPRSYQIELGVDGVSHPRESPPWTALAAAAVLSLLAAYATHRHRRARVQREAMYTV